MNLKEGKRGRGEMGKREESGLIVELVFIPFPSSRFNLFARFA